MLANMKTPRILIALSLAAVATAALAADKLQAQLEVNYKAITAAFQKNDIDGLSKYLAPDCVAHEGTTTVTREKIVADFKQQMARIKNVTWDRKIVKFVHKGDTATVTVDGHFKGTMAGQDGKPHVIELNATSLDVWSKAKSGWLIKSIAVQHRTIKMDGKPMQGG